jgi:hypothetical protein
LIPVEEQIDLRLTIYETTAPIAHRCNFGALEFSCGFIGLIQVTDDYAAEDSFSTDSLQKE